jgi:lysozyme
MKMTSEGLALIRRFEGFRAKAYRDAAGVWTIGYGHTSMAGAPLVMPGMKIGKAEAERMLAADVEQFARGVARLLTRELTPEQFSAVVSFAFNVGLGGLAKSSVLKAVNAGDHAAVARRLQLWVKAGGRVLPGLVKRRAAEAALYAGAGHARAEAPVEAVEGKPALRSTTNLAALLSALAGVAVTLATTVKEMSETVEGPWLMLASGIVFAGAALWIIRERRAKARDEGV